MATGTVNSLGTPLNKRSGPGTSYPVVGSVADGTVVTINCQAHGTPETGPFGETDLWDCLSDGTYVSDAFVNTGTNAMVAPLCGGTPGGSGGAIQQRLDQFVSDWDGKVCNNYDSVPEQCVAVAETWAADYLKLSRFQVATAIQILDAASPADYERINYQPGLVPSPGDIVVFHEDPAPAEGTGSAGHVDVFLSGDASGFTGFDQNWGTPAYCRKVSHDYAAVAGWLHPSHLG